MDEWMKFLFLFHNKNNNNNDHIDTADATTAGLLLATMSFCARRRQFYYPFYSIFSRKK